MSKILFVCILVVVCAPRFVQAQTIAECLTKVQNYSDDQEAKDRKAGVKPNYRAYRKQAKEFARECGNQFSISRVAQSDLSTLARLYFEGDLDSLALAAIKRRLNSPNLTEIERADALTISIRVLTKPTKPLAADLRLAEKQTKELDAMSDAVLKQKIDAHKRMSAFYSGNDISEDKVLAHSEVILKLAKLAPVAERETYARQNLSLYSRIGTAYANQGLIEKALETFREGKAETIRQGRALADGSTSYDSAIQLYSLLGRPAPSLTGAYWINAAPETKELDLKGRVTLIQFTAHWCAPCRDSYPEMLRLYRQHKSTGLQIVMSTQLYGYFADRAELKPEEEVEADRDYYTNKHKLPFIIAVDRHVEPTDKSEAAIQTRLKSNNGRFFVGGFPQTVVLDREGIVRLILIGWGPEKSERTVKVLQQLLQDSK